MVMLEALELLAAAVMFVVVSLQAGGDVVPMLALAGMFLLLALGLAGVAIGIFRFGRWARPAGVAWQILLILFAFSTGIATGAQFWGSLIPAVICLVALFMPATLRAYDTALREQDEASDASGA